MKKVSSKQIFKIKSQKNLLLNPRTFFLILVVLSPIERFVLRRFVPLEFLVPLNLLSLKPFVLRHFVPISKKTTLENSLCSRMPVHIMAVYMDYSE